MSRFVLSRRGSTNRDKRTPFLDRLLQLSALLGGQPDDTLAVADTGGERVGVRFLSSVRR